MDWKRLSDSVLVSVRGSMRGDYVKQLNIIFLILSPPLSFTSDSFKDKTTMIP